jgi:hypothetical protein
MALQSVADLPPVDEDPEGWFWEQRPILEHVRDFARSRRVSPFATLAVILRTAISCVPPHVVLPPTTGGTMSVNLFTTTVGVSGQGKGGAEAAGRAAIHFFDINGNFADADRPQIGTGEGLARLFSGRKDEPGLTRANLVVPEVAVLAAIAGRQGATLAGQLLSAFMGEPLGFNNSSKDTTTAVAEHSYRLCLGVGAQPGNADFFLDREKDGFPQRFLWAPAWDLYAPEVCPKPVAPKDVIVPDFGFGEELQIEIPDSARAAIDTNRFLSLTVSPDVDPLDGHLNVTRLKVAFGLALLEERKGISEQDWKVAGDLIAVSTRTRNELRETIAQKRRDANRARAQEQAVRETIVADLLGADRQARIGKSITGKLQRVAKANRSDLRRACRADLRPDFDPVLETLIDKGFLLVIKGEEGRADEYELAEK